MDFCIEKTKFARDQVIQKNNDFNGRKMNANKKKLGQKIVFIHGKGEGVLRHALVNELRYRYKNYRYQDASFQEYGYGATQVTIR